MTKPSKKEKKSPTAKKRSEKKMNKKASKHSASKDYEQLDLMQAVKSIKGNLSSIRHVIYIIHKNELWKEEYESFAAFEEQVLRNICGRSTTFRNLAAAKIDVILGLPIGTVPITIAELFSGETLSEECVKKTWAQARQVSNKKVPTALTIKQCIETYQKSKAVYQCLIDPEQCVLLFGELKTSHRKKLKKSLRKLIKKLEDKN